MTVFFESAVITPTGKQPTSVPVKPPAKASHSPESRTRRSRPTCGVNIVSIDLPGHVLARGERGDWRFPMWLEDIDTAAAAMRERWQRPVYVLGSSQGSAAAFHSLAASDAGDGAITMCIILTEIEPDPDDRLHTRWAEYRSHEGRAHAAAVGDTERIDLTGIQRRPPPTGSVREKTFFSVWSRRGSVRRVPPCECTSIPGSARATTVAMRWRRSCSTSTTTDRPS